MTSIGGLKPISIHSKCMTMSNVASRGQTIFEPGLRYGQQSSLRPSKTSSMLSARKNSSSRGLLRGSSSLWWVGRKYHRLDQPNETSDGSNDSNNNNPERPPIDSVEVSTPPAKSERRIRWNERVRVRRFEKISPELIEHCYYSEAELYSFHREYTMEEEEEDFPDDDQADEHV